MTDRQEPLTPKEEAALRADHGTNHSQYCDDRDSAGRCRTERWLATLDSDRAARQEAADTSGLRAPFERIHDLASALYEASAAPGLDEWPALSRDHAFALARAALSQEATPDERPLDVDVARKLLAAVDANDKANIHGWAEALRARLSAAGE